MPIPVTCPACNANLRVPDTVAGKRFSCPKCGAVNTAPGDAAGASSAVQAQPPALPPMQPAASPLVSTVALRCPSCQGVTSYATTLMGQYAPCSYCNQPIYVEVPSSAPPAKRSAADPLDFDRQDRYERDDDRRDRPRYDRDEDDDDDDDRYRRRRRRPRTNSGSGTTAMVFGLLSLLLCQIFGPIAIIVGHQALKEDPSDGMATAGVVMGWISTAILVLILGIWCVIFVAAIASNPR